MPMYQIKEKFNMHYTKPYMQWCILTEILILCSPNELTNTLL